MDLGSAEKRGEGEQMDVIDCSGGQLQQVLPNFWLFQGSEAATALTGTRVPKKPSQSVGVSKISMCSPQCRSHLHLVIPRAKNYHSFNPAYHLTHVQSRS